MSKPTITTLLITAALLIAGCKYHGSATAPAPPQAAYFFDTLTGELFVAPIASVAPIDAPSGGQAVRAHVFSCGDCSDMSQLFVGYLSGYTAEVKAKIEQDNLDPRPEPHVAAPVFDGAKPLWQNASSAAGRAIKNVTRCESAPPRECFPPTNP